MASFGTQGNQMNYFAYNCKARKTANDSAFCRITVRCFSLFFSLVKMIGLAALTGCMELSNTVELTQSAANPPTGSQPCSMALTPLSATVTAGAQQPFSVNSCSTVSAQWTVNGTVGGNVVDGTISAGGLYTAPAINPGAAVTISVTNSGNSSIRSSLVTIVNPAQPAFQGATYADTLLAWNANLLPWVEALSGLTWNPEARTWTSTPNWTAPSEGIAPEIYYLEEALRPVTRMSIAHQDTALMEELAMFHVALLAQRTTTIGSMLHNAPSNSIIFIDGAATDRTFAWYEPYSATQVRIRDYQLANAQYLSTATRLLRAIAEMPATDRTAPMLTFVEQYSSFLANEQLLRLMYGSTPWSHWQNPNIPQPVVSAWTFLAATGYRPPDPLKFEAAMTDMEIWMVADSADVLAANQAAPELNIVDSHSAMLLQQAVTAGVSLMQARCHHEIAPDGADILSLFAGDYDDYIDYEYAADTSAAQPAALAPKTGLSWDISHSYRFPVTFRTLYETSSATGVTFPAKNDLVALANTYVHLAFNGDQKMPAFSNFVDGWNGWYGVEQTGIPNGYPPYQDCQAQAETDNCLTPGSVQGWGELATINPSLAALSQTLINLAYDDSAATAIFKDQHYYYYGQHYSANSGTYPFLMVYVAGDAAELLP